MKTYLRIEDGYHLKSELYEATESVSRAFAPKCQTTSCPDGDDDSSEPLP
jgi:hypothetical protein